MQAHGTPGNADSARMPQGASRLWLVITRPDGLFTALLAADALAGRFLGGCHLIIESSRWWDRFTWEPAWRERFVAVHAFGRVEALRGLRDLRRLTAALRERQAAVRALGIRPGDLIIGFAGITRLVNAMVSAFPAAGSLLCVPARKFAELREPADPRRYRWTTPGWLQNRLVEARIGLHRTVHQKARGRAGGDGARLLRFGKSPDAIFDASLVLGRPDLAGGNSAADAATTFAGRFPDFQSLILPDPEPDNAGFARRVIFFGTPFLLVRNLDAEVYAGILGTCLEAMRRWYPEAELRYRPHPAETEERTQLPLQKLGFELEGDRDTAESYFVRNAIRIAAVFSVSSTVSRTARQFGLPAFAFWRLFPFAPRQQEFFTALMGEVPEGFHVDHLDRAPVLSSGATAVCPEPFATALSRAAEAAMRRSDARSRRDPAAHS